MKKGKTINWIQFLIAKKPKVSQDVREIWKGKQPGQ